MDRLKLDLALLIGYLAVGLAFALMSGRTKPPTEEEKREWLDDLDVDAVHRDLARWLLDDAWSLFVGLQVLGWPAGVAISAMRLVSTAKGRYARWVLARWIAKRMRRIEAARTLRERGYDPPCIPLHRKRQRGRGMHEETDSADCVGRLRN